MNITNDIDTGTDKSASLKDEENEIYGLGALVEEKSKYQKTLDYSMKRDG